MAYVPLLPPPPRLLSRTRLAGVVRWRGQQRATVPFHHVGELPPEFAPTMVENGTVQPRLLANLLARLAALTNR